MITNKSYVWPNIYPFLAIIITVRSGNLLFFSASTLAESISAWLPALGNIALARHLTRRVPAIRQRQVQSHTCGGPLQPFIGSLNIINKCPTQ